MPETPDERYADLAQALLGEPGVSMHGQGFGSSSLKADGKIFAMLVRERLVLKLPRERVAALIAAGDGVAYDANKGRPMREWLALDPNSNHEWLALAREAHAFVAPARDLIAQLAGIRPGSALAELRAQRPEALRHAQGSYEALFEPAVPGGLAVGERFAVAARVAEVHGSRAAATYFSTAASSARLPALLRHAELLAMRPRQAGPGDLQALADAGLSTTAIVTLSQVIAYVSFMVRVVAGLRLLGATDRPSSRSERKTPDVVDDEPPARVLPRDDTLNRPTAFTVEQLAWAPWLEPLDLADASPAQASALDGARGNSPYFRLLARDVDVLVERTATDRGIFYTPGGAPRAERELAAAIASRLNGCIYCCSVHARLAAQLSKRDGDIDRLLRLGVAAGTDLEFPQRWQAILELTVALAMTPPTATDGHVARLRALGLSDLEVLDIIQAGAFFAWANRLMLTLGEPHYERQPSSR